MFWKREDFVREVRRQLVELESLRRKLAAASGHSEMNLSEEAISETIARLEASNLCLLRKLDDLFAAAAEDHGTSPDGAPPDETSAGAQDDADPQAEEDAVLACADLGPQAAIVPADELLAVNFSGGLTPHVPRIRRGRLPPSALN